MTNPVTTPRLFVSVRYEVLRKGLALDFFLEAEAGPTKDSCTQHLSLE